MALSRLTGRDVAHDVAQDSLALVVVARDDVDGNGVTVRFIGILQHAVVDINPVLFPTHTGGNFSLQQLHVRPAHVVGKEINIAFVVDSAGLDFLESEPGALRQDANLKAKVLDLGDDYGLGNAQLFAHKHRFRHAVSDRLNDCKIQHQNHLHLFTLGGNY